MNDTTIPPATRICSKCGTEYPLTSEFWHAYKKNPYGLRPDCKVCNNAKRRHTYENNRERTKETFERWYAINSYRVKAASIRWEKENPEKSRVRNQRKRARRRSLPSTLTVKQWQQCLDYFGHTCAVCGRSRDLWHTLAQDHWIPVAHPDCPGTTALNIVPLCHSKKGGTDGCNNLKSDMRAEDWIISRFGKHKAAEILRRIASYFEWVKRQ